MTAVVVALISVAGVWFTARPAFADYGLRRRLETAHRFTELAERAGNVKGEVGLTEQIATIYLLASFSRDEKHLREAGRATLESIKNNNSPGVTGAVRVNLAATHALKLVPR